MPLKMPYTSLYLRRLFSGEPLAKTTQIKITTQDVAWNRLTATPRFCSLRTNCRRVHSAAAQPQTPPARDHKPESSLPEGFEMSEAEIFEREIDPTDKNSWSRGPDALWLHSVVEREKAAGKQPRGPYIRTEEGLVHIDRYYP